MSRKSIIVAASLIFVAATTGLAWEKSHLARDAQAALLRLTELRRNQDADVRSAEKRITLAKRNQRDLETALDNLRKSHVPAVPTAGSGAAKRVRLTEDAVLSANPKLQALNLKSSRSGLAGRYAQLYQSLGFSVEQIARFEDIMMQHVEQEADLRSTALAQGLVATDPALASLRQQYASQEREAMAALLGASGFQQLQEYDRMTDPRNLVGEIAGSVASSDTPLSAQQGAQLAEILANASSGYQNGGAARVNTINWDAVLGQAPAVLSTPQLAALKSTVASQEETQVLRQLAQLAAQGK